MVFINGTTCTPKDTINLLHGIKILISFLKNIKIKYFGKVTNKIANQFLRKLLLFIPVLPLAFVLPANRLSFSFLRKTIIIGEIRRMHRIITYRLKRGTY